jgi:hypothetical protein
LLMEHFYNNIEGWFNFPEMYKTAINKFPTNSHFVEIGSWLGKSSSFMAVEIANSNKNIKFDCVDTWLGSTEHTSANSNCFHSATTKIDGLYNLFLTNTNSVKHIIKPIRLSSLDAVNTYQNNSLDFVFIDASHDYENVKADILAWYPKVKPGGILAGHDYNTGWKGVINAVNEFVTQHNYQMFACGKEDCWGFIKK